MKLPPFHRQRKETAKDQNCLAKEAPKHEAREFRAGRKVKAMEKASSLRQRPCSDGLTLCKQAVCGTCSLSGSITVLPSSSAAFGAGLEEPEMDRKQKSTSM